MASQCPGWRLWPSLGRLIGASLAALLFSTPTFSLACATAWGPTPTAEDYIQSEQAVIIWDEAHKIEHFIRQADIHTKNPDLGFLVPTPQTPELVEVDSSIFQLAADVGRPKKLQEIVYRKPFQIFGLILRGPLAVLFLPMTSLMTGMSNQADSDDFKIISQQNIAGYHAVVLAADNAASVAQWLKENGYESRPDLDEWMKPYIAAKWKITAFKLIKAQPANTALLNESGPIITHAIRMSFSTDRPFFPYSEPGDKARAHAASRLGRTLRVAVLSSERMQGALADGHSWPGDLLFAGSTKPTADTVWTSDNWMAFAKLDNLTLPTTLTYWRDDSNPRPGTSDLYFSAAPNQSSFRKTVIDYSLPPLYRIDFNYPLSDLVALLIVLLLPGAPLYCGWRLIRLNRAGRVTSKSKAAPSHWGRLLLAQHTYGFFGFISILMGSCYFVGCIVATYLLVTYVSDALPGMPLPALCNPVFLITIGIFYLNLLYCGIRAFQCEPKTNEPYKFQTTFGRYWDCLMAAGSILIGAAYSLVVIAFFIGSYLD